MNTIEESISKAANPNGAEICLYAEICGMWDFDIKRDQVMVLLIKELNNKGLNVKYMIEAMEGGKGEFFIYVVKKDKKLIVFSNNPSHKCVIGEEIDQENLDEIVSKIQSIK